MRFSEIIIGRTYSAGITDFKNASASLSEGWIGGSSGARITGEML
jgi:hypothetical protein